MKTWITACGALALLGAGAARAAASYDVVTTFYEPMTQPKNSIFEGSFSYDTSTHTVSNLQGQLSESMTGTTASTMTWISLANELVSWYDGTLGGTFAAVFKNSNTNTFFSMGGSDTWSPSAGVGVGGIYYGFPGSNVANAYALIFVPDNPLAGLNSAQVAKLAYADCNPGGMMGAVCMTGTSVAGYGAAGTMDGYPLSQVITAAVPEPESWALLLAGAGVVGAIARRRARA